MQNVPERLNTTLVYKAGEEESQVAPVGPCELLTLPVLLFRRSSAGNQLFLGSISSCLPAVGLPSVRALLNAEWSPWLDTHWCVCSLPVVTLIVHWVAPPPGTHTCRRWPAVVGGGSNMQDGSTVCSCCLSSSPSDVCRHPPGPAGFITKVRKD